MSHEILVNTWWAGFAWGVFACLFIIWFGWLVDRLIDGRLP